MNSNPDYILTPNQSIFDALKNLEKTKLSTCIIVDEKMQIKGSVTDGDIRRGLLEGLSKDDEVEKVMNKNPMIEKTGTNQDLLREKCLENNINLIPLVDSNGILNDIFTINLISNKKVEETNYSADISAFILAGGEGKRLRPITYSTPKPLVEVNKKSLLEHNINFLSSYGIKDLFISVHYMADQIIEHTDRLKNNEITLTYIKEESKLGTAGPLALIENQSFKHLLVMNADLLCSFSIDKLINSHIQSQAAVTSVITERSTQIPFGVIEMDESENIVSVTEKPLIKHFCLAGIYLINKDCIDRIHKNEYLDMPDFLNKLIEENSKISLFPLIPEFDKWSDIGTMKSLVEAEKILSSSD
jgi:dTDP-glucose pyrophosphorylase